ncbi:MAG: GTPase Era [Anaerolineaceae bacterium]|nr:GTPase Era [Anaerolineaceae bacterium]
MSQSNLPHHFKSGFVAVVGRPNVGKSTLINAFVGQKIAAVSPKPQTTRLNQLGILTDEHMQIVFVDTPGVHEPKHALGKGMNAAAQSALIDADVVLWLVDVSENPHTEDRAIAEWLKGKQAVIQALNKIDLVKDAEALEHKKKLFQKLLPSVVQIMISALEGAGFDALRENILMVLPEGLPFYPEDQITDIYEREIAADLIREAALNNLHDEIPHAIAVRIDEYTERDATGAFIAATIFLERDSQKGIVIGRQGSKLKAIGTAARKAIEAMSGRKVFLDLRVKVKKNWRTDPAFLKQMGYSNFGED